MNASSLIQFFAWIIAIPSLLINILLILSIRRERQNGNRFRWFNSIFLYSVYSNTLITILFPLIHPTYIPARNLIYVVFIGPLAPFFHNWCLKLFYSLLVGIVTYQACVVPITMVMRWLVVQKLSCCTILQHRIIRIIFLVTSLPLPITMELWMNLATPSEKLKSYSEKSQEEAIRKITGGSYSYFALDWNFCYIMFIFIIPYFIFFIISFSFHHLYMRSIWNISNDCIDLGFHHASTINQTLLSVAFQNLLLLSLPHLILAITVIIRWELGVRAMPFSFGCVLVPFTTAITLFLYLRAYRRQVGIMLIELLRQRNINVPIFVTNPQQTNHYFASQVAPN